MLMKSICNCVKVQYIHCVVNVAYIIHQLSVVIYCTLLVMNSTLCSLGVSSRLFRDHGPFKCSVFVMM